MKHLQLYLFALSTLGLGIFTACSGNNVDEQSDPNNNDINHTYHIVVEGGETFSGNVPKEAGGVYYPYAIINFDEEADKNTLTLLLQNRGKHSVGVGFHLDESNNPIPESNTSGVFFSNWSEEVYKSEEYSVTLENYKEHSVTFAGGKGTSASFTVKFEGTFKAPQSGEIVSASGTITIVAP